MNPYRRRVLELVRPLLRPHAPLGRALDFGAGDGWFARSFVEEGLVKEVVPVDVQRRARPVAEVVLYDGARLPFDDRSFDLVCSLDVLHHCPSPRAALRDALRCSDRFFLLKDHNYRGPLGKAALCLLDEIGNRRFGVPSVYHYQRRWEWLPWIGEAGFALRELVHPALCHKGPLGWATNGLQFVGLWERTT
jgi:SAM-dependent methyltransferase